MGKMPPQFMKKGKKSSKPAPKPNPFAAKGAAPPMPMGGAGAPPPFKKGGYKKTSKSKK